MKDSERELCVLSATKSNSRLKIRTASARNPAPAKRTRAVRDVMATPSSSSCPVVSRDGSPRMLKSDNPMPDLTLFTSPLFAPGFFSLRCFSIVQEPA